MIVEDEKLRTWWRGINRLKEITDGGIKLVEWGKREEDERGGRRNGGQLMAW
jgi:hypothetical protein